MNTNYLQIKLIGREYGRYFSDSLINNYGDIILDIFNNKNKEDVLNKYNNEKNNLIISMYLELVHKDYENALKYGLIAYNLDNPGACCNLSIIYKALGDNENEKKYLEKGIEKNEIQSISTIFLNMINECKKMQLENCEETKIKKQKEFIHSFFKKYNALNDGFFIYTYATYWIMIENNYETAKIYGDKCIELKNELGYIVLFLYYKEKKEIISGIKYSMYNSFHGNHYLMYDNNSEISNMDKPKNIYTFEQIIDIIEYIFSDNNPNKNDFIKLALDSIPECYF